MATRHLCVAVLVVPIGLCIAMSTCAAGEPSRSPDAPATRASTTQPSETAMASLLLRLRSDDNIVVDVMGGGRTVPVPRLLTAEQRHQLIAAVEKSTVTEGGPKRPPFGLPSQNLRVLPKEAALDRESIAEHNICDIQIYAPLEVAFVGQSDQVSLTLKGKHWGSFSFVKE